MTGDREVGWASEACSLFDKPMWQYSNILTCFVFLRIALYTGVEKMKPHKLTANSQPFKKSQQSLASATIIPNSFTSALRHTVFFNHIEGPGP